MPSWWGKSSSKDSRKKTGKDSDISPTEQKGIIRSVFSRRRNNDAISEKGCQSRAGSRSPSPSPSSHVSRCQSFADRPPAQPLPLPGFQASFMARTRSEIKVSRPMLEKRGRPPLMLPLPTPNYVASRIDTMETDGNLATASVSSNCSIDSDDPASRLPSPQGNGFQSAGRAVAMDNSSLMHGDQPPYQSQKHAKESAKRAHSSYNNQLLSPKHGLLSNFQSNNQNSRNGAFGSAPDSSMSSPSRSPMRVVGPEQIPSSAFWAPKPYSDLNFLGSGQCSSPGSGQTSGHNSMGGDMSGQLFWQHNRGSAECSPIPSSRMTSPGPSSRIQSGAVTPLHPWAGGTAPGSPTGRIDDAKKQSHRLPLPPINIPSASPFPSPTSSNNFSLIPRSPGRADNTMHTGPRWKKGKLLGHGTFGHVYVGFNNENGDMCAMKEVTLFSDDVKSKESAKHLGQEIALLSKLRHPNIVQYYGSETIDDKLYIYLEYVSGGSIHKLLQEYGPFGEPAIRSYTHQILSGLAYLHAKNTVHRDIKGANILVDPSGRVKLADFGMAKHITGHSCPLSFKGSPYWMAPEVIKNTNGCHLPVDIWSLGCTVLEMATGKPPWSQYEGIAAMFKIGNSKELPTIPHHLSDDGKDFIKQCLQRQPSSRPTAAGLLQHPFVKNTPSTERPVAPSEASILASRPLESAGIGGTQFKVAVHARNLSSLDMERLKIQQQLRAKASLMSSESHISYPVSPSGSPVLHSRSPRLFNGWMSPSPIASPRTTSGASTPLTGGTGAIPLSQPKQLGHLHDEYGSLPRSPNNLFTNGSAYQDVKRDPFQGLQTGFPVFRELSAPQADVVSLPFGRLAHIDISETYCNRLQPVLVERVSQQLLKDQKKSMNY